MPSLRIDTDQHKGTHILLLF